MVGCWYAGGLVFLGRPQLIQRNLWKKDGPGSHIWLNVDGLNMKLVDEALETSSDLLHW
jgi:hypothetical protein